MQSADIAQKNRNIICDSIIAQLDKDLHDISTQDEYILSQSPDKARKRKIRGLINAIGYGMKVLFGTMTESDAEKYTTEISNLEKKCYQYGLPCWHPHNNFEKRAKNIREADIRNWSTILISTLTG